MKHIRTMSLPAKAVGKQDEAYTGFIDLFNVVVDAFLVGIDALADVYVAVFEFLGSAATLTKDDN